MKKLLKVALAAAMSVSLVACGGTGGNGDTEEKVSVGFVTDVGGINDHSFNETSYKGVQDYAKEFGLEENKDYRFLQSDDETQYIPNLTTFCEEEVDILIAAGFLFIDAINETAKKYPNQKMLIIDVAGLDLPNVQQATFAEHEGSYLVGVAAATRAKAAGKDTVGFVMGQWSTTMEKFWAGYQQGVWSVDPTMKILYDDANSFGDAAKGKQLAAKQYDAGAYVIFHAAGGTGNGVISEAVERVNAGEDVWVIGVDSDQYTAGYVDAAKTKSVILTSMMKRVDVAAYNAIKAVADGTFEGGEVYYALKDDGVGIPAENPNMTEDEVKAVQDAFDKIKAGDITVKTESVENELTIGFKKPE